MDTLILVSGAWRSAYVLIRWLRTHPGRIHALCCRAFAGHDQATFAAIPVLRACIEGMFPGRVQWHDAAITRTWEDHDGGADNLAYLVGRFLACPVGSGIKTILTGRKIGVGGKRVTEVSPETPANDAVIEIPPSVIKVLDLCQNGVLHCGKCPQCQEIETAYNQIRG